MRVGVIDYGVGNLGSVLNAFAAAGADPTLLSEPATAAAYNCLVLPGVGNFADCADRLRLSGWSERVCTAVDQGAHLLGICVGMQLLGNRSEEGVEADGEFPIGLGLIPGEVRHLRTLGCSQRLPHVGWNDVCWSAQSLPSGLRSRPPNADYYFVHSYAFVPDERMDVLATCCYQVEFAAAVRRGRVWGTQFHPEKSSHAGLALIRCFLESSSC